MIHPVESIEQYDDEELFNSPDDLYKVIFIISMLFTVFCVQIKLKYSKYS